MTKLHKLLIKKQSKYSVKTASKPSKSIVVIGTSKIRYSRLCITILSLWFLGRILRRTTRFSYFLNSHSTDSVQYRIRRYPCYEAKHYLISLQLWTGNSKRILSMYKKVMFFTEKVYKKFFLYHKSMNNCNEADIWKQ